jgi:hypothetical protein
MPLKGQARNQPEAVGKLATYITLISCLAYSSIL